MTDTHPGDREFVRDVDVCASTLRAVALCLRGRWSIGVCVSVCVSTRVGMSVGVSVGLGVSIGMTVLVSISHGLSIGRHRDVGTGVVLAEQEGVVWCFDRQVRNRALGREVTVVSPILLSYAPVKVEELAVDSRQDHLPPSPLLSVS